MSRIWSIGRHDLRVLRRDPAFLVIMIAMPLVMMLFFKNTFRLSLRAAGYAQASGVEQAVPGGVVMFSSFLMGNMAFSVFREHGYGTWDRLRASRASTGELLAGKCIVPIATLAVQTIVLFLAGAAFFGLRVRGSLAGLFLVSVAYWCCLTAIGLVLLAICRTIQQVNAAANVGGMVLSGLGGAFTPISDLPGWARTIAPGTPHYWAMRGYRSILLDNASIGAVLLPSMVLLVVSALLAGFAVYRFDAGDRKLSFA